MRLLELIVKNVNREDVNDRANFFVQDWKSKIPKVDSFISKPNSDSGIEWRGQGFLSTYSLILTEIAEDAATTIITREELMRAYNMVDDGFTLWFGGESPVDDGVIFDVVYSNGDIRNFCVSGDVSWSDQIIAYKIAYVKPNEQSSIIDLTSPSSPIICDLMRDITKTVPEMMAADVIELADYLIAQGWGKHE